VGWCTGRAGGGGGGGEDGGGAGAAGGGARGEVGDGARAAREWGELGRGKGCGRTPGGGAECRRWGWRCVLGGGGGGAAGGGTPGVRRARVGGGREG